MTSRCLDIELAGQRVRLEVAHDALARRMAALFATRPRRCAGSAHIAVMDGCVLRGSEILHRSTDLDALAVYAEWAVTCKALDDLRRDHVILHAAALRRRRHTLLIAGAHGDGKTTLSIALSLRHGWHIAADDVVVITPRGNLVPFERPVRIKSGTLRLLPELRPACRGWSENLPRLLPLSHFGDAPRALGQPHGIALLMKGPRRLVTRQLSGAMGLACLLRYQWNFSARPQQSLRLLARHVADARVLLLEGGSLTDRCDAIEAMEA